MEQGRSIKVWIRGACTRGLVYLLIALALAAASGCEAEKENDGHAVNSAADAASGNGRKADNPPSGDTELAPSHQAAVTAAPETATPYRDPSAAAAPVYTDEEYAALIASQFNKVHKLDNGEGEYFYELAVLGENEVVYGMDNGDGFELVQHDFRTGKTHSIISLKGELISLTFSSERQMLDISYSLDDTWKFKAWSLSAGELKGNLRTVMAENEKWTLVRSDKGGGIWGAARDGSGKFKLTDNALDHSPWWMPGTNQFVFLAHTDRRINDGSGYEYALTLYDMDTRKWKELSFDKGPWKILGWLEPGKKLLVDHAFNEGVDLNYTEPYIVDLELIEEYPLFSAGMDAYDMEFNAASRSFVVTIPGYLAFYDQKGDIHSLEPWFAYSSEQLGSPFTYSPDGKRGAYLVKAAPTNDAASSSGGRLVITDAYGREPVLLHDYNLPVISFKWSPDGKAIACFIQDSHGSFIVMKELETLGGTSEHGN